jgi:predicted nuclease of restriction endonuclease-like (RecB) superfamily
MLNDAFAISPTFATSVLATRGFSSANLRYIKPLAEAWPDPAIHLRVVGKSPWGQNIELLAVKDPAGRLWYAEATLDHGWSRPDLGAQIDTQAHMRHGKALTNFARTLPPETSDLAQQALKDPYQFDLLTLRQAPHERDVERGLVARAKDLLLELGKGFRSSPASTTWGWVDRIFRSTSCSTIAGYGVS